MAHTKLKEMFDYDFIGSLDAEQFDKTLDFFSFAPHCEVEIYEEISRRFNAETYGFDDSSDLNYDFNAELFSVVKSFAVNHLYDENYDDLAELIEENVDVFSNYLDSRYTVSNEQREEIKNKFHKEFPRNSYGLYHTIFQSLYLCFVLEEIGISLDDFPQEEE